MGLFFEGIVFGGAYVQREICVSKSIGLAYSWKEIYHFCFVTSAEREVKVSRRSEMYQSCNFLTRLGKQSL